MKSKQNPHGSLRKPIRFWAYHTGFSISTLSRWLKSIGVHANRRKSDPGVTLREILYVIPYRRPRE